MTAHGLRVVSGCNSRRHVLQIGIFVSIISLSSKFHAGRRLASRPIRHSLDWSHRDVPPGRSRCVAAVVAPAAIEFAIRTNRRVESAKPKHSSGSPRGTERFFDGNSKKHWVVTFHTHAIPTSEVGEDETGPRSTHDNKRHGNADRRRRLVERPVQPPEKHANFSPITHATGTRFAGAKNHIRNINRHQNLFDIS